MNRTIKTIATIAALLLPATSQSQDNLDPHMENKNSFYYSRKQADIYESLGKISTIAKLEDGSEVIFTEQVNCGDTPISKWDDLIFLGNGKFLRLDK